MKETALKLAIIAAFHGFHDYCLEITDYLLEEGAGRLSSDESETLAHARSDYLSSLSDDLRLIFMVRLESYTFQKVVPLGRQAG